jgi:hypothetical protein
MLIHYTNAILQFNTRSAYNSLHASSFSIPVSWDSIPAPKPNPRQAQIPGLLSARAKGCVLQIMRNISLGIYNESAVSIGQDTIPPPKPIPDRQQIPPGLETRAAGKSILEFSSSRSIHYSTTLVEEIFG